MGGIYKCLTTTFPENPKIYTKVYKVFYYTVTLTILYHTMKDNDNDI